MSKGQIKLEMVYRTVGVEEGFHNKFEPLRERINILRYHQPYELNLGAKASLSRIGLGRPHRANHLKSA